MADASILNMEVAHPSEMLVNVYQTKWHNIAEDSQLHSYYLENLKLFSANLFLPSL
jgi:hypothetical protein